MRVSCGRLGVAVSDGCWSLSGMVVSSTVHLNKADSTGRLGCDVLSAHVGNGLTSFTGGRRVADIEWETHRGSDAVFVDKRNSIWTKVIQPVFS